MKDKVQCPLVDCEIEDIDCIENVDCIEGIQKESSMPNKYKQKKNWKEICRKCKYHTL